MKVLHINRHYLGTELHHHLIDELDGLGIENYVFAPTSQKNYKCTYLNDRVKVATCFKKIDRVNFFYKQGKILAGLRKAYNVEEFDLIHAYTLYTDGNCAYRMFKKYGIPYVVAIRDTDVNGFFKKRPWLINMGIKIMENASQIFFLSESYREQVFNNYIPKEKKEALLGKSCIMPNGIDDFWHENAMELTSPREDNRNLKIICAGRICKRKNIPVTQAAVKLLNEKGYNAQLTLVGKVDDEKVFQEIVQDKNTTYLKPMPKEKLIEQYRAHDLFVMPSITETFGLVYAEAMSQGLPVIYTRGQGFDGQFEEGMVGYAVESCSPESVVEGIEKIIERYDEIKGRVAQLSRKFNWKDISKSYCKIYRQITENDD